MGGLAPRVGCGPAWAGEPGKRHETDGRPVVGRAPAGGRRGSRAGARSRRDDRAAADGRAPGDAMDRRARQPCPAAVAQPDRIARGAGTAAGRGGCALRLPHRRDRDARDRGHRLERGRRFDDLFFVLRRRLRDRRGLGPRRSGRVHDPDQGSRPAGERRARTRRDRPVLHQRLAPAARRSKRQATPPIGPPT